MYLVVIAVLSIVLTFSHPPYGRVTETGWTVAAAAGATILPVLAGIALNQRVLRTFERHPNEPSRGQYAFHRGMMLIHFLLAGGHVSVLVFTNWLDLSRNAAGVPLVLPGVLALVPFLASVVLVWIVVYPSDRAVRQLALEIYLFRGKPLRPVWSLSHYLAYSLRHQVLFILVPMLLILAARDVVLHYDDALKARTGLDYAGDVLLGAAAVTVALIAPEILRHVWVTQRLPAGPLRDRLQLLCRRLKLRCREILVWRSGGMIVNAAVMGVIAPLRYVLITDAMLEQLDDSKIEAVFGHEAGHVKRHHILFFLLFALISGCIVTIFSVRTRGLGGAEYEVAAALLAGLLLFKWAVVFGWVSRRFERQADVFGVRALVKAGVNCAVPCAVHTPPQESAARRGDPLCVSAAMTFSNALYEVALLNGIRPEARSWRHSSISSRSRFVQTLAMDPVRTARFERHVFRIKSAIFVLALAGSLWAATEIRLWDFLRVLAHAA